MDIKHVGIERYQILATLDNRTSDICQEMDGQIFSLSEKEEGINYPPFHPNCRTTTIPYFEPDEIDEKYGIGTRLAKDEDGNYYKVPADTTYESWQKGLKNNGNGEVANKENKVALPGVNNLSNIEKQAVKDYTKYNDRISEESASILSKAIIGHGDIYGKDQILYRVCSYNELGVEKLKDIKQNPKSIIGNEFTSTNFLSTSKTISGTHGFNGQLIKIVGIENTKGLDISSISEKENEKEVIFNKGTKYKIIKAKNLYDGDGDYMNTEIEVKIIK